MVAGEDKVDKADGLEHAPALCALFLSFYRSGGNFGIKWEENSVKK